MNIKKFEKPTSVVTGKHLPFNKSKKIIFQDTTLLKLRYYYHLNAQIKAVHLFE